MYLVEYVCEPSGTLAWFSPLAWSCGRHITEKNGAFGSISEQGVVRPPCFWTKIKEFRLI